MLKQAVILVGGKGSRLGPLTAVTPKPMLEVAGRPFVEHLLQELSRYGFSRVVLLAGTLGDQVYGAYQGRSLFGLNIEVLVEPEPMGTGGALRFAADEGQLDEAFLLMNGDSWIDTDLTVFSRHWETTRGQDDRIKGLMLLHEVSDSARYGLIQVQNGLVTSFKEKVTAATDQGRPIGGTINAGIYVLDRSVLESIPSGLQSSLERDFLPELAANHQLAGVRARQSAYFIDIGVPETLKQSRLELEVFRRKPAMFLDRDGTLNVDKGYTHKPEDLIWLPEAKEAIKFANDTGYFVFVVTNQAGVARGYYEEEAVHRFHEAMQHELFQIGAHVDAFIWCPHHARGSVAEYAIDCICRKPKPGMLYELLTNWPVDIAHSFMIGDSDSDISAARVAGISGLLYRSGSLLELVKPYLQAK